MNAAGFRLPMVLMYHSVAAYLDDPYAITVQPERFARQMLWFERHGIRGVCMRELLERPGPGKVGLTFDDGYADFVTNVMPVLARHGFTATVFVVAGQLGGRNDWDPRGPRKPLLTADQATDLAAAGVEIASHGLRHVRLSGLDDADLDTEIHESRRVLRGHTGDDVAGFCYPYGDLSPRVVDAVRAAGYGYACSVTSSALDGRHAIPRTYVGDRDTGPRLAAKHLRHRVRYHRTRSLTTAG